MKRPRIVAAMAGVCLGLAPTAWAGFDSASIALNGSTGGVYSARVETKPGQPVTLTFQNVTLKYCIQQAYSVKAYQVTGPGWIKDAKYDITATLPAGTAPDEAWPALRSLLAERLGLEVRREKKEVPIYSLTVAKGGPKLRRAANDNPRFLTLQPGDFPTDTIRLDSSSMAELCGELSRNTHRPILDATGINGKFDFDLRIRPSVSKALERQLGLRLEPGTGPVEVLIVENAVRTPKALVQ